MSELKEHFKEKGWCVLPLVDTAPVWQTRLFLEQTLQALLGRALCLEEYALEDDQQHTHIQLEVTRAFREHAWGPKILAAQSSFFCDLLGPDLYIQAHPYLRITRPGKKQDNIGYHRDTFYGGSPYELSVFVPFVNLPKECSLSVLSGSHLRPETYYSTTQIENPDQSVRKGMPKHQLGFLYAPKVMDDSVESQMEAVALNVGEALIFSLATVHGSCLNRGTVTRWSSDMRVMNALAPVDLTARPEYYTLLSRSVVTEAAQSYLST